MNEQETTGTQLFQGRDRSARDGRIVRTSIVGVVTNALLASFKAVIGVITGSIAITMDAVNNLSDAASSVITIIGTKLAGKDPDREHPFGYGRIEYLSALIISVIVLYAGVTSLKESAEAIIDPTTPDYSVVPLVIIAVAVLVKIALGRYFKRVGSETNSASLTNSGQDALMDSVISASTLAAALVYILTDVSLEAWLGAVISLFIIRSGIEMIRDTLSEIMGRRADADLAKAIKSVAGGFPGVTGVYDLVLNNYGPDRFTASLHVEVPDTYDASQIDELSRRITTEVYMRCGIVLTAVGIYSRNTLDPDAVRIRDDVEGIVEACGGIVQMHGFYVDHEAKRMRFDVIASFDVKDRWAKYDEVVARVSEAYPGYALEVTLDTDFSESRAGSSGSIAL